jgi:hypothetical protein
MKLTRAYALAALVACSCALSGACGALVPTGPPLPPDVRQRSIAVDVHGGRLTLHLASAASASASATATEMPASASHPLVLYASGDGGWFGAAVGMFHTIAASGYPTVGIDSKELMHLEQRKFKPLGVAQVADAYQQIIDAARAALQLPPDTPVVLTGWSRGAALGVLAAGRIDPRAHIVGIVAIGLAADEHLDIETDTDDDPDPGTAGAAAAGAAGQPASASADARARTIPLYPLIPKLAPRRIVILQATGDKYLPAARARALLGPDTATTKLVEIAAHNHRFGGDEGRFAPALADAVRWASPAAP